MGGVIPSLSAEGQEQEAKSERKEPEQSLDEEDRPHTESASQQHFGGIMKQEAKRTRPIPIVWVSQREEHCAHALNGNAGNQSSDKNIHSSRKSHLTKPPPLKGGLRDQTSLANQGLNPGSGNIVSFIIIRQARAIDPCG